MLDLALLIGKILFLVLLYWFVLMIVRSATRDLRAAAPGPPAAAALPATAGRPSSGPRGPAVSAPGLAPGTPGPVAVGAGGRGWWALTVIASPALESGWAYEFPPGGRVVVGRSEEADVVLPDTFVSSRHAAVRALPGAVEVQDLGSTNGTFVNGQEVEGPVLIGPGDELSVGDTVFRVEAR